jgi:hypothetical protein
MPLPIATALTTAESVGRDSRIAVKVELDGTNVHNKAAAHNTQIPIVEENPVSEDICCNELMSSGTTKPVATTLTRLAQMRATVRLSACFFSITQALPIDLAFVQFGGEVPPDFSRFIQAVAPIVWTEHDPATKVVWTVVKQCKQQRCKSIF